MTPLEEVAANQEERIESNIIDMKEAFYDREPDLKIVSDSQSQINKKPLYYRFIKRAFDVVFSLIVIVITFIPMLILSVFVAIDTKAFPIYSQERVGHKGPFKFFKMRSMVRDSDDLKKYFTPEQIEQWNKEHKVDSDPRITVLGSFLRRTSLDELPQFFNVLMGQIAAVTTKILVVKPQVSSLRAFEEFVNSFCQNMHTDFCDGFSAEKAVA
ncbi:sugar transferase [Eggerthella lenta]|uniref:Bacterial sugar transferase domain-containing protein n=1 Tax=Eggerthella lenta TaxID=84112 RepID=A0A369M5K6_EGGLN|nr:sugar transferase [Eggerthella lenta]RDB66694.1 hypothetical protein C1875_13770 [Eggerthella lenta]